jgi:hypothetical protein
VEEGGRGTTRERRERNNERDETRKREGEPFLSRGTYLGGQTCSVSRALLSKMTGLPTMPGGQVFWIEPFFAFFKLAADSFRP